jgi:3-deoxy-7-phosphoheptulonate synthase
MLRESSDRHDLKLITEVMEVSQIPLVEEYAHILQVGARNMQNYSLLRELGKARTPVLLKRGMSATIEEWLMSAEYILAGGNMNVMLCERGIRTFESYTRNTLDISAIPVVQQLSHLPVISDFSSISTLSISRSTKRSGGRSRGTIFRQRITMPEVCREPILADERANRKSSTGMRSRGLPA